MTGGERPGPIASLRALPSWTAAAGLLAAIVFFSLYGSGLSSDEAAALWPAMHEPWNLHALAAYPSKMLAPLWPAALALVFKVIPDTLTFARLVSFVCAVWSLALVARLVEESWDRFRGGIAAALVAVQPAFVLGAARAAPLSASLALLLWMIRDWRKQRARPADQPPSRSFVARGLLLDLAWWPGLAVLLFVAADGHRRTTDVTVRRAWVRAGIVWTVPWVALLWGFHFLANRYPSLGEFWFFSGADLPAWPAYWPLWVPRPGTDRGFRFMGTPACATRRRRGVQFRRGAARLSRAARPPRRSGMGVSGRKHHAPRSAGRNRSRA
ncbi:MAG: glycosyltransferase family 39 protein [Deltaproteobacteria bacterium]|nr:glycosyltransferase family 39 protein [Deltaproteobacteria bacterium]